MLAVAFDAADWTLVEPWARAGYLPNVRRLLEQGARARLQSTADWLAGSPWPGFHTGRYPPDHGLINSLQWRPGKMRHERVTSDWIPIEPFYRRFGDHGKRVIAMDVPITYQPTPMDGIELTSWSAHERSTPAASWPPEFLAQVLRQYGRDPVSMEVGGVQKARSLFALRDSLISSVVKQAALCEDVLTRNTWDLCIVGIGATHTAGHKLWDRSSALPMTPDEATEYDTAQRAVFQSADTALGRLMEVAGPSTTVLCFALHGMQVNTSCALLAPEMLWRILSDGPVPVDRRPSKPSLLRRVRDAVPIEWRTTVKERLPAPVRDSLTAFWRGSKRRDWSRTRAFTLLGDFQTFVQVNLRGREAEGIVEQGAEFDALCERIADGFTSFRDADTGEPVVADIARGDRLYPEANYEVGIPDLIVRWAEYPVVRRRALVSDRFGTITFPHPGRPPEGRSGHHGPPGWLLAVGDHIASGADLGEAGPFDLGATIHHLVGVPKPASMLGRVIPGMELD